MFKKTFILGGVLIFIFLMAPGFVNAAISYSSNTITISGSYDSGTVTSATASTLTDTSKSWTASNPGTTLGLGFRQVWITGGTGVGQVKGIKSNTATQITLWDDWDTMPDATSTYAIGYAPRDIVAAQGSYVSNYVGLGAPDSIVIDTDTDLRVANGGYYGSCGSPAHIFEYSYRDLGSVAGSHMAFGRLQKQSGYGSGGGIFSFGVNVADPTSGGKYDGAYHIISIEGDAKFYGSHFIGAYDFYYDAALGITGNRRSRIDSTTSSGDGKIFIDCTSDGLSVNSGVRDTFKRVVIPNINLHRDSSNIEDILGYFNFGLQPGIAGNGVTFSNLKFIGSPDYITRVTGRPFFLYQWRTANGNPSQYIMNFEIPIAELQGTNIVKSFQFDLASTANNPNGVIWLGFTNDFKIQNSALTNLENVTIGCKDVDGNAGWLNSKNANYPYNPVFTYAKKTDLNGVVEDASIIKGKIQWNGKTTLANSYGAWSSGYPNNPWTLIFRKYGYLESTQTLNPDNSRGKQTIRTILMSNPYIVANETTVSEYSSKFSIDWTNRIINVTKNATHQEMYDYTQYEAAKSDYIQYDSLMTVISSGVFDMGDTQIITPEGVTLIPNSDINPASLILDKILSLYELNSTHTIYNITLKLTNKGGSNATSVNITDTDSDEILYWIGTLESGQTETRSYLKTFERNFLNYNYTFIKANSRGIDSLLNGNIESNSSKSTIIIPATTADNFLTVFKNVEFISENLTHVLYNLTIDVVNSWGIDLSGINVQDLDIGLDEYVDLNKTQSYSISGIKEISKSDFSFEHVFAKANTTYDATTYYSNELSVLIPAIVTNASLLLSKSASFYSETFSNITYNISLTLTNIGGRNTANTFIYESDSDESSYNLGTLNARETKTISYLKTFEKQIMATSQNLNIATSNAIDSISEELIEANSNLINILIPAKPSSASLVVDKIASFHNLTNETFTYNITLKITNKGGSNATSVNITDTDSDEILYGIGTLESGQTETRSYLKTFERNSKIYYNQTQIAQVQGIDSFSGLLISSNSTQANLTIPSTEKGEQLIVIKNVYYNNQTLANVNYTSSIEIINSGGEDLNGIVITDDDSEIFDLISLNIAQSKNYSSPLLIAKEQNNKEHTFSIARANANLVVYSSQQIKILVPGYGGGPNDVYIEAPTSVSASTNFNVLMTIKNVNPDIGQDFILSYQLLNENESLTFSSGAQTLFVAANGETNSTTITFLSPSTAGNYKIRANVTGEGVSVQATALSTIIVPFQDSDTEDTGMGEILDGGGSITGRATEEVVCNFPYIRYGKECCLDANNNSICDNDDFLQESYNENETSQENQTDEEIEKPEKQSQFNEYIKNTIKNTGKFFSSIIKQVSKNKIYFFICFGALILVSIIFLTIKFLIERKPRDITRLKSIKGIIVYGADGQKIGKVREIYLEENKSRIYGWLIKVDKNNAKKIKKKNILVRHKHVESIKHIMILDKRVSEHLEKLDSKVD
jgi:sporulation protein YlmC with PRC-barrel domain